MYIAAYKPCAIVEHLYKLLDFYSGMSLHFCSVHSCHHLVLCDTIFRLRSHSGSSAASQDSLFLCLFACLLVVAAKSTFTIGLLMKRLEIQDLGSELDLVSSFATKRGVAYFKSAATPFYNNSGTVGPRKLKFGI